MNDSMDSKSKSEMYFIQTQIHNIYCLLLIIFTLLILVFIVGINQMWEFNSIVPFNQHEEHLYTVLQTQYFKTIEYFEYVENIVQNVENESIFSPLNLTYSTINQQLLLNHRFKIYNNKGGMACVNGSCPSLSCLRDIIQQYSQFTTLINSIAICVRSVECVHVPIDSSSFPIMNEIGFSSDISAQNYNNSFIIGRQANDTVIMMELSTEIEQFLPKLSESLHYIHISDNHGVMNYTFTNPQLQDIGTQVIQTENIAITDSKNRTIFELNLKRVYREHSYLNFTKLCLIIPVLLIFWIVHRTNHYTRKWLVESFQRKNVVNKLYKFALNEVFQGKKPIQSLVIGDGPINEFYRLLCELPDKNIQPVNEKTQQARRNQPFIFNQLLGEIQRKFRSHVSKLMESKSRQIILNRFNVNTCANQAAEEACKRIKTTYERVKEMELEEQFFKFSYYAILKQPDILNYIFFLDSTALPPKLQIFILELNRLIHRPETLIQENMEDITKGCPIDERQNLKEIQIRIKIILVPKCINTFKDLDVNGHYAKKFNIERKLWSLSQKLQNMRHLFTRHHKNIRTFGK